MIYLLDSSVVIALADAEHPHRSRCDQWFETITRFALCPVSEGALVRFFVRTGRQTTYATAILQLNSTLPGYEFWPDEMSYIHTDLDQVRGHKQVTDAYLVSLVRRHPGSQLATLDEGLAALYPAEVCLIPEATDPA
ncbi:MAG: VapC toxin family PIN domain ribonuclease [Propionibacteriaceae bacterium]|jgi:predicted nucleic acid-binding protein|nr:VapC toxin family PIN domain ribonuclease [Propionibacteriaceae bacterium]